MSSLIFSEIKNHSFLIFYILWGKNKFYSLSYFVGITTERRFLPFALLLPITFLPLAVCILLRKPWVLFLLTLLGWYVLFDI